MGMVNELWRHELPQLVYLKVVELVSWKVVELVSWKVVELVLQGWFCT